MVQEYNFDKLYEWQALTGSKDYRDVLNKIST